MRENRLLALLGMAMAKNIEQEKEKDVVSWLNLVVKLVFFSIFRQKNFITRLYDFLTCFNGNYLAG